MKFFYFSKIYLVVPIVVMVKLYGIPSNDFTKANTSFSSKSISFEKSRYDEKKYGRGGEKYPGKRYSDIGDVGYMREMKAYVPNDKGLPSVGEDKMSEGGKSYDVPKERVGYGIEWDKRDKELGLVNIDRDMYKKYSGRIDFDKKSVLDSRMKEYMEEMSNTPMDDLNRFLFRESRENKEGMDITKAGGELFGGKEEGGILDFFSRSERIDRSPISVRRVKNLEGIGERASGDRKSIDRVQSKDDYMQERLRGSRNRDGAVIEYENMATGERSGQVESVGGRVDEDNPKVIIKEVELSKGFLIPKEYSSGKATIRVETK